MLRWNFFDDLAVELSMRTMLICFILSFACTTLSTGGAATHHEPPWVYSLDSVRQSPLENNGSAATVFVFALHDCPICNSYLTELNRLKDEFSGRGVTFIYVYDDEDFSAQQAKTHHVAFNIGFTALLDPRHEWASTNGITVAPEVIVRIPSGQTIYRGTIDDRYPKLGVQRPVATVHDLEDILNAYLDAKPLPTRGHELTGCALTENIR